MLWIVTFIFNQFLHVTFSHMFAVSFVQDTLWFCGLILIHLFYIKLLVYSFWCFETITYNKQSSIKDTSFSFLYDFTTKGFKQTCLRPTDIQSFDSFLYWNPSQRPPYSVALFSVDQVKKLTTYAVNTYVKLVLT